MSVCVCGGGLFALVNHFLCLRLFLDLLFAVRHLHPVLPHLGPLVAPPPG